MTPIELLTKLVRAGRRLQFRAKLVRGKLAVGSAFVIGPRARVAHGATVSIGNRVNIGADLTLQAHLVVGDDVMVSSQVAIIGNDHDFSDPAKSIQDQPRLPRARVVLEGDNLIGFGSILVGPVVIGRGTIVGAGSLVTRDLPPNSVCIGRPAAPYRLRR